MIHGALNILACHGIDYLGAWIIEGCSAPLYNLWSWLTLTWEDGIRIVSNYSVFLLIIQAKTHCSYLQCEFRILSPFYVAT